MGLRTFRLCYLHTTIWRARLYLYHQFWTSRKLCYFFFLSLFKFRILINKWVQDMRSDEGSSKLIKKLLIYCVYCRIMNFVFSIAA